MTCAAVAAWQPEIQQDEVERLGVQSEVGAFASHFDDDLVGFCFEAITQGVRDLFLVLDDQDTHGT